MKSLSNNQKIIERLQRQAIYLLDLQPGIELILKKLNEHLDTLPVSVIMQYYCKLHDFHISTLQYSFEILANFPTEDIKEYKSFINKYSRLYPAQKKELLKVLDRLTEEEKNGQEK